MTEENKEIEAANTADNKKRKIAEFPINVRRSLTCILCILLLFISIFCCAFTHKTGNDGQKDIGLKIGLQSKRTIKNQGFTTAGSMLEARYWASAVLLKDGRIFIAGGRNRDKFGGDNILKSTEIFDVKTGKSESGPDMSYSQQHPFLWLLSDGRVLIVTKSNSGYTIKTEIYNPNTNSIDESYEIENQNFIVNDTYAMQLNPNETFVFNPFLGMIDNFIYNNKTKSVYSVDAKKQGKPERFFGTAAPIGKINNYMFFQSGAKLIKISTDFMDVKYFNIPEKEKGTEYIGSVYDNSKIILLFDDKVYFFNIYKERFENSLSISGDILPKKYSIKLFKADDNIFLFKYRYPNAYEHISKLNIDNRNITEKKYHTPARWGFPIQNQDGSILYIGGEKINECFRHSSVSKKIYMLNI